MLRPLRGFCSNNAHRQVSHSIGCEISEGANEKGGRNHLYVQTMLVMNRSQFFVQGSNAGSNFVSQAKVENVPWSIHIMRIVDPQPQVPRVLVVPLLIFKVSCSTFEQGNQSTFDTLTCRVVLNDPRNVIVPYIQGIIGILLGSELLFPYYAFPIEFQ